MSAAPRITLRRLGVDAANRATSRICDRVADGMEANDPLAMSGGAGRES